MMLRSALSAARDAADAAANTAADTAADTALPLHALSAMFSLFFALAILYGLFLLFYFLLRKSYRALRRLEKPERCAPGRTDGASERGESRRRGRNTRKHARSRGSAGARSAGQEQGQRRKLKFRR